MEMVSFEFQVLASLSAAIFMLFKFPFTCTAHEIYSHYSEHLRSAHRVNGTGASDLNAAQAIPTISEENAKTDENSWEVFRT
jgi:hypothetical protein